MVKSRVALTPSLASAKALRSELSLSNAEDQTEDQIVTRNGSISRESFSREGREQGGRVLLSSREAARKAQPIIADNRSLVAIRSLWYTTPYRSRRRKKTSGRHKRRRMMAGTGVGGVGGVGMLRTRRRDVSVKPNRKLDRKSSRGMIYENEELRLRTIHINAEVEQGKGKGTERAARAGLSMNRRWKRSRCVVSKGRNNAAITLPFLRLDRAQLMRTFAMDERDRMIFNVRKDKKKVVSNFYLSTKKYAHWI